MMAAATGQRLRPRCAIPLDSLVARAFYESAVENGLVAREQRKLAAILAADVVGYSRLMGRDESGTLARFRSPLSNENTSSKIAQMRRADRVRKVCCWE